MTFTENKRAVLKPQKEKRLSTFILALLTAAAFFVPYMIMAEGYFTFYGDFNVQQIPFYQMCHNAIREGNMGWNWLTDLGANFIGSYSFYLLGSPFFWITLPFPNSFVPYLMGPLLILKFACAALTGYLYIRRFTKTPNAAQIGGLLSAFSGFSVYNVFFNHFHEAIILFPLLLLALELLITENRRGIFALAVALCAVSNYFFFFGMVVFCVIYFFVRLFSRAVRVTFARFITLVFEAVIGVALAAVLLYPSILAILGNSRISEMQLGWNAIMYGKEQIYLNVIECFFFPPDLPARPVFFPGANVKWSSLGGWMPIFSMVGVFAFFMNRKGSWLKRMIGICTFMALVPVLNSAFYAFNTAYYARWYYMPILLMSLATVTLTEDASIDWRPAWKWVLGITLGFALTIGLFPQRNEEEKLIFGLYSQDDSGMYVFRFWLTVAIAVLGLIVLRLLIMQLETDRKKFFTASAVCICLISILYGNVFIFNGRLHSYEIKDVMIDQLIEGEVELPDEDNYRVDVFDGVDNTGMYLELPCINAFHSVVPSSIMEFYEYIGIERDVASRPDTDDVALRSLLSVRYLLNRCDGDPFVNEESGEADMEGFEYLKTSGGYYIYENENYIPYGFSYDYYMNKDFCDGYSEKYRSALMLKAILLDDEQIEKYGSYMTDIDKLWEQDIDDIGNMSLTMNGETLEEDSARLADTAADSFKITKDGFTATVSRDKRSLVFFSVPYDEGWSATVDGREVEVEKVNVGFMAVPVEAGSSEIVFTYKTPGLMSGLFISGGALVLLGFYLLLSFIYRRSRPDETEYPEGDELLMMWRKDEIFMAARTAQDEDVIPINDIFEDPVEIPHIDSGFEGGFKIDPSIFEDKK